MPTEDKKSYTVTFQCKDNYDGTVNTVQFDADQWDTFVNQLIPFLRGIGYSYLEDDAVILKKKPLYFENDIPHMNVAFAEDMFPCCVRPFSIDDILKENEEEQNNSFPEPEDFKEEKSETPKLDESEMSVKVTGYTDSMYWYARKIGSYYDVVREETDRFWVRDDDDYLNFILKKDCQVFVD